MDTPKRTGSQNSDPAVGQAPGPSSSARSRPGSALLRITLAVVFVGLAAVMVVEGILIHQIGLGKTMVGRLTSTDRGPEVSTLAFELTTADGTTLEEACQVPTGFLDELPPGENLDIYYRFGLRDTYACVAEGLPWLHSEGTTSMFWGLGFGLLSLVMILWLLVDFARYTQKIGPAPGQPHARMPSDKQP